MDNVVCPKCGQSVAQAKFCGNCGLSLSNDDSEKITTQQRNILLAMRDVAIETPDHPSTIPKIADKIKSPKDSIRTMIYQLKTRGFVDRVDRGGYLLTEKGKTVLRF